MEINLTNSKKRDAKVNWHSLTSPLVVRWVDGKGRQATNRRILKGTMDRDIDALVNEFGGLDEVGQALIDGDPEIDLETYGTFLEDTARVYTDPDKQIVHKVVHWEIVRAPDGSEKERRPRQVTEANTATDIPLTWSGKLLPRDQVYNRFVFSNKLQITHHNGLTYDFLYGMAKELQEADSLLLVAAGEKGNEPLVFRNGGRPYRGFLEGRIDGENYALILHLSDMELKRPEPLEEA